MFSVLFPGQGSQSPGMAKVFYDNFDYVKSLFHEADDLLNIPISNLVLKGPKEDLDLTENTQPAIFLVSYSIFQVIKKETSFDINSAKYFAGHSLGEYSALCCAEALTFSQTIQLLKKRGAAMQTAVPKGHGGMIAVLGSEIEKIEEILNLNRDEFNCYIANDNSLGQVVVSGKNQDIEKFVIELKKHGIKNIKLSVSAPFHCKLMENATKKMDIEISKNEFKSPNVEIISNVTSKPTSNVQKIKELLVSQIEKPVRWRETINFIMNENINKFIEIGPGKVLSGLVKRINRNADLLQINNIEDLKKL